MTPGSLLPVPLLLARRLIVSPLPFSNLTLSYILKRMTKIYEKAAVSRVKGIGRREASFFENSTLRMQVDDIGGMIPFFCNVQDKRQHFRKFLSCVSVYRTK